MFVCLSVECRYPHFGSLPLSTIAQGVSELLTQTWIHPRPMSSSVASVRERVVEELNEFLVRSEHEAAR